MKNNLEEWEVAQNSDGIHYIRTKGGKMIGDGLHDIVFAHNRANNQIINRAKGLKHHLGCEWPEGCSCGRSND